MRHNPDHSVERDGDPEQPSQFGKMPDPTTGGGVPRFLSTMHIGEKFPPNLEVTVLGRPERYLKGPGDNQPEKGLQTGQPAGIFRCLAEAFNHFLQPFFGITAKEAVVRSEVPLVSLGNRLPEPGDI
jgi:hypothetical protein